MITIMVLRTFSPASKVIIGVFLVVLLGVMLNYVFGMLELLYVIRFKKPFFVHFTIFRRHLNKQEQQLLEQQFPFYNKLAPKQQLTFRHRVKSLMLDKQFTGRQGIEVTTEMRVLIAATAAMLTFGFRNFYIGLLERIVIYPKAYFSKANQAYHKGEFNPQLKTLALSWEDFKAGLAIDNDNLNLGVHELAHAIHLNALKEKDANGVLFLDSFDGLTKLLQSNTELKDQLVQSEYFRDYAYTNQYEFLAVLIENFIETPEAFKQQFPEVYNYTKQMLNFNFAGY